MLTVTKRDVVADPFPHIVSEQMIEPALYTRLRADYPDASIFEEQKSMSSAGSRTGQGFDIYRGDDAYARLIERSEAWAEFDGYINSRAFVDKFLELFGPHLDKAGIKADIDAEQYSRDLVEGRDILTEHQTLADRVGGLARKVLPRSRDRVRLFTRLDIHKALTGYAKAVHCDRPNRLCSFVLYFVDADKEGLKGGQLTLHAHRETKPVEKYERHPKPEDAPVIATLTPKENLGVLFACCNNSYHGVTAVESEGIERDFLYINISGDAKSLW
jgi:hypothetical protein